MSPDTRPGVQANGEDGNVRRRLRGPRAIFPITTIALALVGCGDTIVYNTFPTATASPSESGTLFSPEASRTYFEPVPQPTQTAPPRAPEAPRPTSVRTSEPPPPPVEPKPPTPPFDGVVDCRIPDVGPEGATFRRGNERIRVIAGPRYGASITGASGELVTVTTTQGDTVSDNQIGTKSVVTLVSPPEVVVACFGVDLPVAEDINPDGNSTS